MMTEAKIRAWLRKECDFLKERCHGKGRVTLDFCDVEALRTKRILEKILGMRSKD